MSNWWQSTRDVLYGPQSTTCRGVAIRIHGRHQWSAFVLSVDGTGCVYTATPDVETRNGVMIWIGGSVTQLREFVDNVERYPVLCNLGQ